MSSLTHSFSPLALSRPNQQTYRKNLSQKPNTQYNSNPKSKPKSKSKSKSKSLSSDDKPSSSSSSISVEATTYTRLPPKDDFLAASLIHAFQEIKLSESTPVEKTTKEGQLGPVRSGGELSGFQYEDYEEEEFDDEEEDDDFYEEEEDDDFYEEDDEGEMVVFEGQEFDDDNEKEKEKGVPAVMRCFDRAKIYVKAGNGGNGVVAFRREKFVPLGGPSGGDGGRGGNVYVEVDGDRNSLLPFRNGLHFRAGRGAHGRGRNQHGAKGEDVVVKVAPGTIIREAREEGGEGEVLLELLHPGQRALLLPGGRGGRGNAAFKSGLNKVPKIAEKGEEGPEM